MAELARMFLDQSRQQLRIARRSPRGWLAAVATPIVLLALLHAISDRTGSAGFVGTLTAGMITLGMVSVCFSGVAGALVTSRDSGLLKRLRASPLPVGLHLAGRVTCGAVLGMMVAALVGAIAVLGYGARLDTAGTASAIGAVLLGAISLSLTGVAAAQFIPHSGAAAPALSLLMLPVVLISGVFFPVSALPGWAAPIADALPVGHLMALVGGGFGTGGGSPVDALALLAWGVAAAGVAVWRYRWEPSDTGDQSGMPITM